MRKKYKKKLSTLGKRLLRIPRTRGFGVQSPTAYSFVRKVLNERIFLASYRQKQSDGLEEYPFNKSRIERLQFRLAYSYYNKVKIVSVSQLINKFDYDQLLSHVETDTVLFVKDIDISVDNLSLWKHLVADKRCILTFDLLDCGVVFFDKTKFKQHFKVNY